MKLLGDLAAYALAAVFFVSAVTKLAEPRRWVSSAAQLGVGAPIAVTVPILEVGLAALLAADVVRRPAAWAGAALLVSFTVLLASLILRGRRPPCACFGSFSAAPIGWLHVARNVGFVALAVVAATAG